MTRAILNVLFCWGIGMIYPAVAAQETYTREEYENFSRNFYRGCMDKQTGAPLNSILLPAVIEESCKCAAERMTADLFGSIDFQLAMSRKDGEAVLRATSNAAKSDAVTRTLIACRQESADRRGGQSKILREGYSQSANTKIGLAGESRRGFVVAGIQSCKDAQVQKPENKGIPDSLIDSYCRCSLGYMADRLSEAHLLGILKEQVPAIKFQEDLGKSASNYCLGERPSGRGKLKPNKPPAPAKPTEVAKPTSADCEAKAVSKDGKPLHGAAKAAFINKCEKDAKAK